MSKNISTKRIGIDARFYGPMGKGLGRYTQEVVDNIIIIDEDNEYVVFLTKDNFDEFETDNPRVKKVITNIRCYSLAEQVLFPFIIARERLDLIHFPHFNVPLFLNTKFVVTIHDLILTKFPTTRASTLSPCLYKLKNLAYRTVISSAVRRSKKIITVSSFTKKDLVDKFKVDASKIIVTYEGVANLAKGNDSLLGSKISSHRTIVDYNLGDRFLLYVGNAYPHKNLNSLVEVFERLHRDYSDLKLVLVGKEDYFYNRLKEFTFEKSLWREGEESPVIFTGYVLDVELEILFKKALLYIFPSFYEGFGLPPLEAMAKKCPVISSDKASLPEILGDAAIYFDPYNKDDMYEKIKETMFNNELKEELIEKGLEQIKKYNWWECALVTLNVYKQVLRVKYEEKE